MHRYKHWSPLYRVVPTETQAWVSPLWSPISGRLPHRQLPHSSPEGSDLLLFLISLIRTIKRFTGQMDGNPAGCSVCPWGRHCRWWGEMMSERIGSNSTGGTLLPSNGCTGGVRSVFLRDKEMKRVLVFFIFFLDIRRCIYWNNRLVRTMPAV